MNKKTKSNTEFRNKKAFFNYEIINKIEAGIVLQGTEVKSIRNNKVNINGTYCIFSGKELFIKGMNISVLDEGSYMNHDPKRDRKLLLHKKQLRKLKSEIEEKGLAVVPLKLYQNSKGVFKMEIALAKGRKLADKREYIKDRDSKREIKDIMG